MLRIFFCAVLLLVSLIFRAQEDSASINPWKNGTFYFAPHFGFIVPHTAGMLHLIQGHSFGGSVQYLRQSGTKTWENAWHNPQRGFDFTFINTGNARQFGNQFAFSYIMHLPVYRQERVSLHPDKPGIRSWIGIGLGAGYATKTWDLRENTQAAVIGSHLNVALTLQYQIEALAFSKGSVRTGIRITHFSNGSYKTPNLGTNNASLVIAYLLKSSINTERPKFLQKHRWMPMRTTIGAAGGLKEIQPPLGKKYSASTLSFFYDKRISFKSSFGAGLDLFYNSSLVPLMERYQGEKPNFGRTVQVGIVGGYTMHFNDFEFKLQQGFYVKDNWKSDGSFYNRFGLRYFWNNHFYNQLTLKTHFAKADFGELGLGYAF
ncbi:MAG: acyloxyacyl hydrolase [Flavobacteriales bacterium]